MAKMKILLIDDDELSREGIIDDLEVYEEFFIRGFGNGVDAIDHLEQNQEEYKAVLLDYVLDPAILTGEAVLQKLRKQFPGLPVIVFTGKDPSGGIHSLGQGAYSIMQRPLDFTELVKILRDIANLDQVFMKMAEDVLAVLDFDICLVWRLEKQNYEFRVVGCAGSYDENYVQSITLSARDLSWQKKYRDRKPIFLKDVQDEEEVPHYIHRDEAATRGWTSFISVPLFRNDRLLGLIDCYTLEPFDFIDDDQERFYINWLQKFANQAIQTYHASFLVQKLHVVQEISQNLASTLEVEPILQSILLKTIELVGADCGWFYLLDAPTSKLKLGHWFNIDNDKLDEYRALGEGVSGLVAQEGVVKYVPDVHKKTEGYSPKIFKPTPGKDIRSEVAVPLRRGERTIGVLTLKSALLDFFTLDDIDLVISLAAIAAVAIERAKLTKHLREISRLAQDEKKFENVSQYVVEAVRDLTGADVNFWMMSQREGEGDNWMRITSSSGNVNKKYIRNTKIPTKPGSCYNANALDLKQHIIIPDLRKLKQSDSPRFYTLDTARKLGWVSFMAVPMLGQGDEYIGVISLYSVTENKFSDNDGQLIQTFANQAGLALQQQRRIRAMELLAKVGPNMANEIHSNKCLFKKITTLACEITKAQCSVIYPYDPNKGEFYRPEEVAGTGLRNDKADFAKRPRKNGMAAQVLKHGFVIVDDVDNLRIRVGRTNPKRLNKRHKAYQEIAKHLEIGKFIKGEKIKAYVGVSLRAQEKNTEEPGANQEVAVLYFNYRAPHRFSDEELQIINIFASQIANIIHRTRLYDRATRQKEVLEAIQRSAIDILAQRDQQKRLEGIVEAGVKLLAGRGGKIYLVKNSRKDLQLYAAIGIGKNEMPIGRTLPRGKGMAGYVVRTKKPLRVKDYPTWSGHIKEFATLFSAVVEVPLMFGDEVIGVLAVFDDKEKREFSKDDEDVLKRLASQAALAIHNINLYHELDTLYNTGLIIAKRLKLKELANEMLRQLRQVKEFDRATIQLIQSDKKPRELLAYQGFDESGINQNLLKPIENDRLIQTIVRSKKPKILSYTHRSKLWNKDIPETKLIRSWAGVPLIYDDMVLGIMTLDHQIPGHFQKKDEKYLLLFANQAAIAIQNAQLFESLEKRKSELEELDQQKSDFLSTVSHELRSPLAPIKSCIQLMLKEEYGPITKQQRDRLEIALASVDDEATIVQKLLDLVRIEGNRVIAKKERVDFSELMIRIVRQYEYNAKQKGTSLSLELPKDEDVFAMVDKELMLSILTNLIGNGIKFTPENGEVRISVFNTDTQLVIKIADNGMGFSEDQKEKIFEKFYQVDRSLTRRIGGMGIGLSIVQNFIQLHDGYIQVESKLGEGSCFTITIPQ